LLVGTLFTLSQQSSKEVHGDPCLNPTRPLTMRLDQPHVNGVPNNPRSQRVIRVFDAQENPFRKKNIW
jgi:hypothetical protein